MKKFLSDRILEKIYHSLSICEVNNLGVRLLVNMSMLLDMVFPFWMGILAVNGTLPSSLYLRMALRLIQYRRINIRFYDLAVRWLNSLSQLWWTILFWTALSGSTGYFDDRVGLIDWAPSFCVSFLILHVLACLIDIHHELL